MRMLYDSNSFAIIQQSINEPHGSVPHDPYAAPAFGYEIVDKRSGKELFLHGDWAKVFGLQLAAWIAVVPEAEEVEGYLDGYCVFAQLPIVLH